MGIFKNFHASNFQWTNFLACILFLFSASIFGEEKKVATSTNSLFKVVTEKYEVPAAKKPAKVSTDLKSSLFPLPNKDCDLVKNKKNIVKYLAGIYESIDEEQDLIDALPWPGIDGKVYEDSARGIFMLVSRFNDKKKNTIGYSFSFFCSCDGRKSKPLGKFSIKPRVVIKKNIDFMRDSVENALAQPFSPNKDKALELKGKIEKDQIIKSSVVKDADFALELMQFNDRRSNELLGYKLFIYDQDGKIADFVTLFDAE